VSQPVTVIELDLAAWIEALPACVAAGAKVYPWKGVPQYPSWPYVCYHRITSGRVRSTKGPVGVSKPLLQVDVFAKTYLAAARLAGEIRESLDTLSGDLLNGRRVQVSIAGDEWGSSDDGDDPTQPPHGDEVTQFRVSIPLRLWFEE
jgi:hypothetical protein